MIKLQEIREMAEDYRERLQSLFRKLFQFDSEDLDFGIYRIMKKTKRIL